MSKEGSSEKRRSKKGASGSPLDGWREALTAWEREANEALANLSSSPEMAKLSGRAVEGMAQVQQLVHDASNRYLQTVNMPTRDDVLALGERLVSLEDRLGNIERMVQALAKEHGVSPLPPARAKPKRTRQPPSRSATTSSADGGPQKAQRETPAKKSAAENDIAVEREAARDSAAKKVKAKPKKQPGNSGSSKRATQKKTTNKKTAAKKKVSKKKSPKKKAAKKSAKKRAKKSGARK